MQPQSSKHEGRGPAIAYCSASVLVLAYASVVLNGSMWELSRVHNGTVAFGAALLIIGMVYGRKSGDRIHLILASGATFLVAWHAFYLIVVKLYG
ncbi:MAG: hypothetical protein ACFHWZ_02275 [Phycisphaerales bacterium]